MKPIYYYITLIALPIITILSFVGWYGFSSVTPSMYETALIMEVATSFGQGKEIVSPSRISTNNATNSETVSVARQLLKEASPQNDILKAQDMLNEGNLFELVIDSLGMFLYMGISIIGLLIMLRFSNLNKVIAILCMSIILIGFVAPIFNLFVLKERWWYLSEIFLSIPLSIALILLINKVSVKSRYMAVCLILIIVFFNIIGLPSNTYNRMLSPNLIVRYTLTEGELAGKQFINKEVVHDNGGILGSDSYYVAYIQSDIDWYWPQRTKVRSIDKYILSGNFVDCPYDIIMLRESLYKEPFAFGNGSIYKLNYNPIELAQKQGYEKYWWNEEVVCLVRK